ncbi:MAG: molybdopterin containing oxidoreductase [Alphaproteobacteria bacterium 13_2_20CM_2_64_7]|jgi:sulfite oxidase|nr:MAG: molybdopterin containing oxidoreductase [Alphaproteobacteria bacterium 13_2_20CM_2_64_7]
MPGTIERSIEELYHDDRERADAVVFGRRTQIDRRGFLGASGLAAMGAAVGATIPFADRMPGGLIPAALAQSPAAPPKGPQYLSFPGKSDKLVVLGERPLVAETPEHLLDDDTTPVDKFFIRNNGQIPEAAKDPDTWKIVVDGEVNQKLELTLAELKAKFRPVTQRMVLECGGNGRSFFSPQARGNQWTNGGVGCAEWTGVRLADVLKAVGVKSSAVFTGHYGADRNLADASKDAISRGIPIKKALDVNNLIVFAMDGQPLPNIHGGPVRLIIPGWPGSASSKWLTRIWVRDKVHDGPGMGGTSYRVAINPMVPGDRPDEKNFRDLESMPVRSIITSPMNGTSFGKDVREVKLRGAAWAGDLTVRRVDISTDFGASWKRAQLTAPKNPYDWQRWTATVKLPSEGYYEIWTRATDSRGIMQPHVAGSWNPQGYGGNPMHRIAIRIA